MNHNDDPCHEKQILNAKPKMNYTPQEADLYNRKPKSPTPRQTDRTMNSDLYEYDVIQLAIDNLDTETFVKIAKKALEERVKAIIRTTPCDSDDHVVLSNVCERIQRVMPTECAQKFAQKLYEDTEIDARKPRFVNHIPARTIGDILKLHRTKK